VDAGKVKTVLSELREELHARRGMVVDSAADDGPVRPAHHSDAADLDSGHPGRHGTRGRQSRPSESGEGASAPELSQPRIPELTLPFAVPQEPFVVIKPQFVSAILAAAIAALLLMVLFL